MKALFHVHSNHSFDSFLKPETIVDYSIRNNFDILSITDHNTIEGSIAAGRYNPSSKLHIIIGAEYATDKGDIIGLFLNNEIKSNVSEDVINNINAQGGIVVLPHPFRGHKFDSGLVRNVDLIEIYNGRVSNQANQAAKELARKYDKQIIAGSDAHFFAELGLAEVIFEAPSGSENLKRLVLEGNRKVQYKEHSKRKDYELASQLVKSYKLRDIRLFTSVMKHFALRI